MINMMLHCVCSTCRQAVEPGQDMFPVWSQVQCAVEELGSEVLRPPTCKHWRYLGRCSYGDKCFYTHDAESYELWKSEGDKTRKRGPRGKLRVRNKSRAFAFRRFLIDTFGSELLQQGTGVLDVAGGKGELSFELVNLNGIPTTVVDPRVSDLQEYRDKWDKGLYTRNRFWQTYSPSYDPERTPQDPNHVHAFFENPLGNHFAHPTEWGLDSQNLRRWWVQCMRRAQCDSGRAGHGFRRGFAVHKKEKEIVPYDPRKEEEEEMHEDDMHEADGIEGNGWALRGWWCNWCLISVGFWWCFAMWRPFIEASERGGGQFMYCWVARRSSGGAHCGRSPGPGQALRGGAMLRVCQHPSASRAGWGQGALLASVFGVFAAEEPPHRACGASVWGPQRGALHAPFWDSEKRGGRQTRLHKWYQSAVLIHGIWCL